MVHLTEGSYQRSEWIVSNGSVAYTFASGNEPDALFISNLNGIYTGLGHIPCSLITKANTTITGILRVNNIYKIKIKSFTGSVAQGDVLALWL